ncbi:MAG TPA: hypothetical protein VLG76_07860 [Rhabdochlamydiaceae bacterium]|nr:hypothetical protein [Rhabdochlamydiaceae bacterium]
MPDFTDLFAQSKGAAIEYRGKTIIRADKYPIKNGDILIASIEKACMERREGFAIDITGYCELDGKIFKQGKGVMMLFWADTAPKEIKLKIFTKREFVWVHNIWEHTNSYITSDQEGKPITKYSKSVESLYNGAAMIVEEIENGRRYYCNDGRPDENFDDIIFTVQKLKE